MRSFHVSDIWKITSTHWSWTLQSSHWCGEDNKGKGGKKLRYCHNFLWGQNSCSKSNPCTLLNFRLLLFSTQVSGTFMVSSERWGSSHKWVVLHFQSWLFLFSQSRPQNFVKPSSPDFPYWISADIESLPARKLHLSMTSLLGYHEIKPQNLPVSQLGDGKLGKVWNELCLNLLQQANKILNAMRTVTRAVFLIVFCSTRASAIK